MVDRHIGFIGGGQMARALARGFLAAGLTVPDRLHVFDPDSDALRWFREETGGAIPAGDNVELLDRADTIFMAVKPQFMDEVLRRIGSRADASILFVSIAAGVRLGRLTKGLGSDRVIRVMPNTPCLIGQGASCFSSAGGATEEDRRWILTLLESVGIAAEVPEPQLDAVTGLSGSGPAFVYALVEALSDGAVAMGMPRDLATRLAAQTARGAAAMILETGEHPAVLKERVTSPGGTTIAGLRQLEDRGLHGALMAAVEAATRRSRELGHDDAGPDDKR